MSSSRVPPPFNDCVALGVSVVALLGCSSAAPAPEAAADAGIADVAAPDRPAGLPTCHLMISASHANVTAPEAPIAGSCPGERTDDGDGHRLIDFQPADMKAGVLRTFSIEQFEVDAPAGTRFALEAGFDPLGSRGVSVRYLEVSGGQTNTWRADRGVLTLVSTADEAYTMAITGAHMVPAADPNGTNRASGDFALDGTITSILP
jgi:hypothetical protein